MSSTDGHIDGSGGVDSVALRVLLDGPRREVREHTRAILSRPEFAKPAEPMPTEEYRARVSEWTRMLASTGGPALLFPEEFGGLGRVGDAIAGFETLALSDLSLLVKCGVQFGLFGGAVHHLGTRKHHEAYLQKIASLELPGCFAMSETGHGSNVQQVETRATYDADAGEFVVHTPTPSARKDYIGNAARDGHMAVVFAQLEVGGEAHGVHALLVPIRDEDGNVCQGVTIEDDGDKLGLQGVDNGRISFDHVRVPRENLLDRYAKVGEDGLYDSPIENKDRRFFTTIGTLIQGRISVSGAALSATKSSLAIAVRYAARRRQFGPPDSSDEALVIDYRVHQRRLFPRLATTYAIHFAQRELIAELHKRLKAGDDYGDREQRQLEAQAAGVKAASTWHATDTIQACREACGGAGYLMVNRFAAMRADTDVFTTFEGDNTILLQLVAKGLLTDFKQRVGDLNALEMVRFYGEQVMDQVVERSLARQVVGAFRDIVPSRDDESYDDERIEDREWQVDLFRWREEHILGGVARRLRAGLDDEADTFEVFNDCQDHVLAAARAHVDRLIVEAFAQAIEDCEDDSLKPLLDRLFDLHALSTVERERGWFFEHGRMTAPRSKAITKAVNRVCAELRDDAEVLVDAFAIPDAVLAA